MLRKSFVQKIIVGLGVFVFVSCDKDFNTIDASVIGEDNYDFEPYKEGILTAYNQGLGIMQSNNLPVNPLGIYQDANFQTTSAHFVTQLQLNSASFNPVYGENLVVDKVELLVPYFSTKKSIGTDGTSVYELDSIYGTAESKMKLSVYENGYFLRDTDPESGFTQAQRFFTDQRPDFDSNRYGTDADGNSVLFGNRLNDAVEVSENDQFFYDKSEIVTVTEVEGEDPVTTYSAPSMVLNLNKEYFKKKIFSEEGKANMVNNNTFKNYFKGLYFKIEQISGENGEMALLDFSKGKVKISYSEDLAGSTNGTRVDKTLELNMTGNTVSLQDISNVNTAYSDAVSSPNTAVGDSGLFLKGGSGSMTVIDLFGPDVDNNGVADQLEGIRSNGWMINEASITFYIDRTTLGTTVPEPNRIYLYDLKNNRPLIDYYVDATVNTVSPKNGKYVYDGRIQKLASGNRGEKYKIRITNHIANLIRKDSTNVQLGLVITEDYRITSNMDRKNASSPATLKKAPTASVMSPLGTILYGNTPDVPEDKRIKFEIFYTKPN